MLLLIFFCEIADQHTKGKLAVHCKSGYRSVIAASILMSKGAQVVDIMGGYDALITTDLPLESPELA